MLCFFYFCLQNKNSPANQCQIFWSLEMNYRPKYKLTYKHYPQENYIWVINKELKNKLKVNVRFLQMSYDELPVIRTKGEEDQSYHFYYKESQYRLSLGTPSGYN